jgi:iron complex transport system substrate-binding protein
MTISLSSHEPISTAISTENLLDIDGDALFFVSWGREEDQKTLDKLKQNPLWQHLKVVQNNRVYFVGFHWHSSDIFAMHNILDDLEKYLVNLSTIDSGE